MLLLELASGLDRLLSLTDKTLLYFTLRLVLKVQPEDLEDLTPCMFRYRCHHRGIEMWHLENRGI